ncbi:50S ribosomal protein L17 [Candidatus Saccharibacteria bacterium]|nr:50S ribosomal protein L17 [Candidatus Saccharibacteria bacterium]
MHRHGYKGRKFGRETDQRTALTRGLMRSLFKYQSITTTLAKAKEIRRPAEKLITLAKRGDLAARRLIIARLDDRDTANFLVDTIAPQIKRNSGFFRIEHAGFRRGDNSEMGIISFVDKLSTEIAPTTTKASAQKPSKNATKEEK